MLDEMLDAFVHPSNLSEDSLVFWGGGLDKCWKGLTKALLVREYRTWSINDREILADTDTMTIAKWKRGFE